MGTEKRPNGCGPSPPNVVVNMVSREGSGLGDQGSIPPITDTEVPLMSVNSANASEEPPGGGPGFDPRGCSRCKKPGRHRWTHRLKSWIPVIVIVLLIGILLAVFIRPGLFFASIRKLFCQESSNILFLINPTRYSDVSGQCLAVCHIATDKL